MLAVEFEPSSDLSFVTCGKEHVYFWSYENGNLSRKKGLFDSQEKPKYVTCLAFADDGVVLTGDSNGSISVWTKGE